MGEPAAREDRHFARQGQAPPSDTQRAEVTVTAVHYQGAVTRLNTVDRFWRPDQCRSGFAALGKFGEGETLTLTWQPEALHVMAGEA